MHRSNLGHILTMLYGIRDLDPPLSRRDRVAAGSVLDGVRRAGLARPGWSCKYAEGGITGTADSRVLLQDPILKSVPGNGKPNEILANHGLALDGRRRTAAAAG